MTLLMNSRWYYQLQEKDGIVFLIYGDKNTYCPYSAEDDAPCGSWCPLFQMEGTLCTGPGEEGWKIHAVQLHCHERRITV